MTPHPTNEVEAGRELDATIAERVMGWTRVDPNRSADPIYSGFDHDFGLIDLPKFSTDIGDAWQVVENIARRGWKMDVQNRFWPTWGAHVHFPAPNYAHVFETADSAPLAICKAALQAVQSSEPIPEAVRP